eukprot:6530979-Alexandrium_andersonii.AAC.1
MYTDTQARTGLRARLPLGPRPGETQRGRAARTRGPLRLLEAPHRALTLHLLPRARPAAVSYTHLRAHETSAHL